ncbi:CBS domain-containing protein [Thiogranum longum]|jgi:CBS domain-containing protein
MTIGEICSREVTVMDRSESVEEAVKLMREDHVGDVVVTESRDGKRVPLGILTDRDVLIEVVAKDVPLSSLKTSDVMSGDLLSVTEHESESDAISRMRSRGVRRAPVVDAEGFLVGIVSIDDLLEVLAEDLSNIAALISREQKRERDTRTV